MSIAQPSSVCLDIGMKKVALGILQNTKGEFLLQHKDKDAPHFPDMWCLFGGGIEAGEEPPDTVVREIWEELRVVINGVRLVAERLDDQAQIHRYFCIGQLDEPIDTLKSQLTEGDDVGYFSREDLRRLNINPAHLAALIELG